MTRQPIRRRALSIELASEPTWGSAGSARGAWRVGRLRVVQALAPMAMRQVVSGGLRWTEYRYRTEYGLSMTAMQTFMDFQVTELQPHALAQVRWNHERVAVAGSSLGGLVSMHLALSHPQTYSAVASLSGAFWPLQDEHDALRDHVPGYGKQPLAVYIDSGGNVGANSDGAADSAEVRDLLVGLGWARSDSPACTPSATSLCYFLEPGATHDELAWKARAWRFLRFLFPAS